MSRKFFVMAIAIFFLLVSVSFAAPQQMGVPHQFYGKVTVNGKSTPNGLLIVAKIEGRDVAATTTLDGGYGYTPNIFYVQDPNNNRNNKPIIFYVSGIQGGTYVFKNFGTTNLDLSVTGDICGDTVCTSGESCSSCPQDCGSCSSGGSGGGGGGGTPPAQQQNQTPAQQNPPAAQEPVQCTSDWQCTDWLDCVNGNQKRVCVDTNKCGTEIRKDEARACENPAVAQKSLATGSLFNDPVSLTSIVVVLILIIALIAYYLLKKRKPKVQAA